MRILLTGFGPFGSVVDNPTTRLVRHFDGVRFDDRVVDGLELPTSFASAPRAIAERLASERYDIVLMLGVAETSAVLQIESVGRNRDSARIADVDGARPTGTIDEGAPELLPVTVDAAGLLAALGAADVPATLSDNAGSYVCNHVLFRTLLHLRGSGTRAGFVHVPPDPATTAAPLPHAVAFERLLRAVRVALSACR